jgi:predicted O-linked N-acetylglucosamine transferase (SPINDLY family)
MWMGVPVITCCPAGATIAGRAGLCQLQNLGLLELVARTPEEFVSVAAGLSRDLPRLANLRQSLRSRMERSPLMDAPRFAQNFGAACLNMWQQWRDGTR